MDTSIYELSNDEICTIQGGALLAGIAAGIAAGLIISAIDNWDDIKQGTMDAHRDAREHL